MTRSLTEINQAIAWQLKESIGEDRFDLWFGDHEALTLSDGKLNVWAKDQLSVEFLKQQFQQPVNDAVCGVLGHAVELNFCVTGPAIPQQKQHSLFSPHELAEAGMSTDPEPCRTGTKLTERKRPKRRGTGPSRPTRQSLGQQGQPNHPDNLPLWQSHRSGSCQSLESFHFGKQNLLLETAIQEIFDEPGKFNPLYLHGPVGCGKTHLTTAIVTHARQTRRYRRCVNVTAEQFTSSFIDALQNRRLTDFRSKFRNLDLLAMDDIQFLAGKQATVVEFQSTLDALLRNGKQVVVSADRPLAELRFAEDSLFTRLSAGLACPIRYPDVAGRIAILRRLGELRNIPLSSGLLQALAERISRDVRLLSGAINRLKAASLVSDEPVNEAFAEKFLTDLFQAHSPIVSLARIEKAVCEVCGVESNELKSSKRIQRVSTARMLAMWLSREYTSAGLSEIGKYYGGRSHSTVVAAQKKIKGLLQTDAAIALQTRQVNISAAVGRLKNALDVG